MLDTFCKMRGMSYSPRFTITTALLTRVERIAALRERILAAAVDVTWIPAMQMDTRARNAHSSTAIEGNPLTLEQVRAVAEGREIPAVADRARREVLNYFAGLRFIEKHVKRKVIGHEDILKLHRIVAAKVMDQGNAGHYRTIRVQVGQYMPPRPEDVSSLMFELLEWWPVLEVKLRGHYQYYGVSGNMPALRQYYATTLRLTRKWLNRRSQRKAYSWKRFMEYLKHYPLPLPRITHNLCTLSPIT